MNAKVEKVIKIVYRRWKKDSPVLELKHPDENVLACYLDDKLSAQEKEAVKNHLIACDICARIVNMSLSIKDDPLELFPQEAMLDLGKLMELQRNNLLEALLELKDRAWEIIQTNADVLMGQELIPASLLRSRQISKLKEEVALLKDFNRVRVEVRLHSQGAERFNLNVTVKDKFTQKIIPGLRITLFQDDLELESYASQTGSVVFENAACGKYRIEISSNDKLAAISIEVKT